MVNNNINWMGNKVIDTKASHQISRTAMDGPYINNDPPTQATPPSDTGTTTPPPIVRQGPPPATDKGYIPAYLERNIGKNVRAEFVLGTSNFTDRTGKLIEVGVNYFVLEDANSRTNIMCDLYSVKFVTILQ
jgi:hypothetical protein